MNDSIEILEQYLENLSEEQKKYFLKIHYFLLDIFPFKVKIRYEIPFYDDNSWICYLNLIKNIGFELCFVDGNLLSNEQNILESRGRKRISGIILKNNEKIPEQKIIEIIHEALLLSKNKVKKS